MWPRGTAAERRFAAQIALGCALCVLSYAGAAAEDREALDEAFLEFLGSAEEVAQEDWIWWLEEEDAANDESEGDDSQTSSDAQGKRSPTDDQPESAKP